MNYEYDLEACPFCGGKVMFRQALHISDGNTDAIIHAEPTACGMLEFCTGTVNKSVIAAWNRRARRQVAKVHQSPFGASLIWTDGDCVHMPHGTKLYIDEGLDDPAST